MSVATIAQQVHPQARFLSFDKLREAHIGMLRYEHSNNTDQKLLRAALRFLLAGQATGAILDSELERSAAQSMLDYWSTALIRAGQEPPFGLLDIYDPRLAPQLPDEWCPYVGLDAFRESKSELFFGRERFIAQFLSRLETQRLLIVLGLSGTGKSSAVLGGLLPELKRGALPESNTWCYYPELVPGPRPLESLARSIKPRAMDAELWKLWQVSEFLRKPNHLLQQINELGTTPAVLVIDQFEELFTLCDNARIRQAFVTNILTLVDAPGVRHTVILTMRNDFEDIVSEFPDLKRRFDDEHVRVNLTSLNPTELRDAIEKPARSVQLKFEDGVVDALVQDIVREPAGLPLLQLTLLRLWEKRQANRIPMSAYRELRGVRNALATSADTFYKKQLPEDQMIIERIFLYIVQPTEGLDLTSRRVQRAELYNIGYAPIKIDHILSLLQNERLIRISPGDTAREDQVEVAHEALIRNWPRLTGWLSKEREDLRRRRRLTSAAEQWSTNNREPGTLWSGSALDEALQRSDLSPLEREFLDASVQERKRAEQEKEEARQRELAAAYELADIERRRASEQERAKRKLQLSIRQLILALIATVFFLIIAILTGIFALRSGEQARIAEQEAHQAAQLAQTEVELRQAQQATAERAAMIAGTQQKLAEMAAATAGTEVILRQTQQTKAERAVAAANNEITLRTIAEAQAQNNAAIAQAAKAEAQNNAAIAKTAEAEAQNNAATAQVAKLNALNAFNEASTASARLAATAQALEILGAVLQTQQALASTAGGLPVNVQRNLTAIAATEQAQQAVTTNPQNTNAAQRLIDQAQRSTNPDLGLALAIEAANVERSIAVEETLQTAIQKVNDATNATIRLSSRVTSATWNEDGSYILITGENDVTRVWNPATKQSMLRLRGAGTITSAAWSSNGQLIVTGSSDGWLRIYDANIPTELDTQRDPQQSFQAHNAVTGVSWSPDDTIIVSTGSDTYVRGWNANTEALLFEIAAEGDEVISRNAFSPNGLFFTTSSNALVAQVRSAKDGTRLIPLRHAQAVNSAAWSPDGNYILTASDDGIARTWSITDTKKVSLVLYQGVVPPQPIKSAMWNPSGRSVVGAGADGFLRIWNTSTGKRISNLLVSTQGLTMATWSPDGRRIVVGAEDRTVRIYYVYFDDILQEARRIQTYNLSAQERQLALQGQLVPPAMTPTPQSTAAQP